MRFSKIAGLRKSLIQPVKIPNGAQRLDHRLDCCSEAHWFVLRGLVASVSRNSYGPPSRGGRLRSMSSHALSWSRYSLPLYLETAMDHLHVVGMLRSMSSHALSWSQIKFLCCTVCLEESPLPNMIIKHTSFKSSLKSHLFKLSY